MGDTVLGQKLLNTQHGVNRYACKSPIMKWAKALKVFKKKLTEAECSLSQQRQLIRRYRWVSTTLTLAEEACTTRGLTSRR